MRSGGKNPKMNSKQKQMNPTTFQINNTTPLGWGRGRTIPRGFGRRQLGSTCTAHPGQILESGEEVSFHRGLDEPFLAEQLGGNSTCVAATERELRFHRRRRGNEQQIQEKASSWSLGGWMALVPGCALMEVEVEGHVCLRPCTQTATASLRPLGGRGPASTSSTQSWLPKEQP